MSLYGGKVSSFVSGWAGIYDLRILYTCIQYILIKSTPYSLFFNSSQTNFMCSFLNSLSPLSAVSTGMGVGLLLEHGLL